MTVRARVGVRVTGKGNSRARDRVRVRSMENGANKDKDWVSAN